MPDTIFLQPLTPNQDPVKYQRRLLLELLTTPRRRRQIHVANYPSLRLSHEVARGLITRDSGRYTISEVGKRVLASLETMFAEREPNYQHYNIYAD